MGGWVGLESLFDVERLEARESFYFFEALYNFEYVRVSWPCFSASSDEELLIYVALKMGRSG